MTMDDRQRRFLYATMINGISYEDIATELKVSRKELSNWWTQLAPERERIRHWRTKWRNELPQVDFWEFYTRMTSSATCSYCGITADELAQLFDRDRIRTKRNRGRKLEVDRMDPNADYSQLDNLVLACYWCNNAKTDEFTAEEFKPIGQAIGHALRKRL